MRQAVIASTRATCDRRHVGAVLVQDKRVLATGYNGSIRGQKHCDEGGHLMRDGHCVRTIHAEANALLTATRHGVSTDGAKLYVTCYPCWACFKLLAQAGVKEITYENSYRVDPLVAETARRMGISLAQHELGKEDMDRLTAEIYYDPDDEGGEE